MTITFKALAALLAYPTDELCAALPEILAVLENDRRLPRRVRADLAALAEELRASDPLDAPSATKSPAASNQEYFRYETRIGSFGSSSVSVSTNSSQVDRSHFASANDTVRESF